MDRQVNRANRVKLALEVHPEEMVHLVRRVCWVWLVPAGLPEMTESMDRVVLPVHLDLLVRQVMELVMTQLLWRHCLATDKLAT